MPDQYDFPEDADRLPEGFKRIAYDSDSMQFTFRDINGRLYQGEAGAEYGILTPMSASTTPLSRSRPNAFASESSISTPSYSSRPPQKQKSTFHDILPSNLITTPSLSEKNPQTPNKTGSDTAHCQQFVDAVRKSVLPKMQGVAHNLHRSVTSIRGKRPSSHSNYDKEQELECDETLGLIRSDSPVGSDIRRSATVATSRRRPCSKRQPL